MNDEHDDTEERTADGAAPPHRTRLSIPSADETTIAWLAKQENVSASVRCLVREYVRREGFTDPTCLAVEQQPRRGRPPGSKNRRSRSERRQRMRDLREGSDKAKVAIAALADRLEAGGITDEELAGLDTHRVQAAREEVERRRVGLVELGVHTGLLEVNEFGDHICTACGWRHPDHDAACEAPRLRAEHEMEDLFADESEDSDEDTEAMPPLHSQIVKDTDWRHHDHEDGHGREGEN